MSSILFFLLAIGCCLGGASALTRRRRVGRWPVEKAHVVHCMEALPFGDPLPPPSEQLVVVIRRDGTEEELVSRTLHQPGNPSVTWFAELVYFVDGVATRRTSPCASP